MTSLRIRRQDEDSHVLTCGDNGTGKSQLIFQLLDQIQERGDIAVVLDSQREYLPIYLSELRGDWVLNPKDDRCPYWSIGDEGTDEADFTAVVESLFPPPVGYANETSRIFHTWTTGLAAFLLANYHPTTVEFGNWMVNISEIDKRIRGSEHEQTLTKNATNQHAGIIGTLNTAGKPLRMMPAEQGTRRRFSVREWAANPSGWIFVTNTQDTREALRPLQSMWLDLLLMRLMSRPRTATGQKVWFILDELASLQTLPQLHSAITEARKSHTPIVIGIQNMAQLEDLYGKKAETILSQAYTKVVFATSEPRTAESLSKLVGEGEYWRTRETRSGSLFGRQDRNSYSGPEEFRKPLILPSEIQALPNMEGYFLQRGKAVKIKLPYIDRPHKAPALIERTIPPMQRFIQPEAPPPPPKPSILPQGRRYAQNLASPNVS